MKKVCLLLLGCAMIFLVSCTDSEKVKDPEALYQKYLKDDVSRKAKVKECKLLSVDKQMKSQTCSIAFKADGDKDIKKTGLMDFKPADLSQKKQEQAK